MKKFKKIIVGLGILGFSFGLGMKISTYAAENEPSTSETTEVATADEKVTIEMKLVEFQNKWLTPIISGALGLLGSLLGYVLYKKRYKIIMATMSSGIRMTEQQRKEANEDLARTKELYETAKADFEQKKKDYETLMQMARGEIEEMKQYRVENTQFKQLIGYLVAASPELMKSGYGEKILKLLDEGVKIVEIIQDENVGDVDGTNN